MNILFVQKVKGFAGSEKYFLELIPALQKRGFIITLACVYNAADRAHVHFFIDKCQTAGINIKTCEVASDKSLLKTLNFIRNTYKTGEYELVHSHLIHADFWASLLKRFHVIKCPLVSTKHGYEEQCITTNGFDGSVIPKNLYYRLCKFSEKRISQSFAVSNGLEKLFIDAKICRAGNITTIHHGFDLPALKQNAGDTNRLSENQIIIIGRVIPFKGHLKLIQALAVLKESMSDFHLLIVGATEDKAYHQLLLKEITKLELDNHVLFTGFKSNIYDYLSSADIMVIPSIAEGFGLVFLEAMHAKLPIIGFDVAATNEIIEHNNTGILIEPYNIASLGEAIHYLFNNPNERMRLGNNAKDRLLSYFTLKRMVDETVSFYGLAVDVNH